MIQAAIIVTTVALILMYLLWWTIYELFTTESKSKIATIAALIVLFSMPYIFKTSSELYATWDKMYFQRGESGEVQIAYSPMKIPAEVKNNFDYCKQFLDQNGNPIKLVAYRDDGAYCGSFKDFYKEKFLIVPYKLLSNGKAEYWAAPGFRIIGKPPTFPKDG